MNLLFITPKLSYSGAPKIMAWIANGLVKRGHNVTIVVAYQSKCEQPLNKDVKVFYLGISQSSNWIYRNTIGMFKIVSNCRKIVKKVKPDAVISFLDSISQVYIVFNGLFWKDKIIVSERVDPFSRRKLQARFLLSLMKKSKLVVFQTKEAKSFFEKKNKSLTDCVIPNPVVLDCSVRDAIRKRKQMNDSSIETLKITTVGRLSLKQKRQDVLLKAMMKLKCKNVKFKLYIYGSGSDEKIIKDLIKEYSLEKNVKMMGQKRNIPFEIYDSDCFVLTSDFEGIPNALVEAMSIGIPCVSTDCSPGGARLLIKDGVNGFLVERENYELIANKIIWIKDHKDESRKIGQNAIKIADDLNEEKILTLWENELKKVAEQ